MADRLRRRRRLRRALEQIADSIAWSSTDDDTLAFDAPTLGRRWQTFARGPPQHAADMSTATATSTRCRRRRTTTRSPGTRTAATAASSAVQHTISTAAVRRTCVFAADVDGDGDLDVLSASGTTTRSPGTRTTAAGTSCTAQHDHARPPTAPAVFAADVDGDGDLDVLSASRTTTTIAWYENDGAGDVRHPPARSPPRPTAPLACSRRTWTATATSTCSPRRADDDKIAWYENDGSQHVRRRTITTADGDAWSVFAADVDGDGDMDVLSASSFDDKIAWYENDGSAAPSTAHTITHRADRGRVACSRRTWTATATSTCSPRRPMDDKIAWYENDGSQTLRPRTIISTAADGAESVFAADVDGDGDLDVLSASHQDDKIAWYENDGSQVFTARTITTAADGA